jgi:hypothetical protein
MHRLEELITKSFTVDHARSTLERLKEEADIQIISHVEASHGQTLTQLEFYRLQRFSRKAGRIIEGIKSLRKELIE